MAIRQQDLFADIFIDDIPESGLLLPYEQERVLALILSLRRAWAGLPMELSRKLVLNVIFALPSRGLDPVKVMGWLMTGDVPKIRVQKTERMRFDSEYKFEEELEIPWLYGLAGSSVFHRQLRTAKWYPNDWDVYCANSTIEWWFHKFLLKKFKTARPECCLVHIISTNVVSWWICGPIRINLIMSCRLAQLDTFDMAACACHAPSPFHTVRAWPDLKDRFCMRTRGAMTLRQMKRYNKWKDRLGDVRLVYCEHEIDPGYDHFDGILGPVVNVL